MDDPATASILAWLLLPPGVLAGFFLPGWLATLAFVAVCLVGHNLGGTLHLLEYCRRRHGAAFVRLSTSRGYSIPPLAALPVVVHRGAFAWGWKPRSPLAFIL